MTSVLDSELNLRKRHPFSRGYLVLNQLQSLVASKLLPSMLDISYGDSEGQRLDVFPGKSPNAPVFIFIHGGYFRALDKSQYRFIAPRLRRLGFTTVLVNYDLAPKVSVSEIFNQVQKAIHWIAQHSNDWQGDPEKLYLCGHSVGAVLAARVLEKPDFFDPNRTWAIRGALLLSGIYKLTALQQSYLNTDLHLSAEEAEGLSADVAALKAGGRLLVAVGDRETNEFVRQSRAYSRQLSDFKVDHTYLEPGGINHYSMSRLLVRKNSPVLKWLMDDGFECR